MIKESVIIPGEIYFLREIDVLSGEKSPYVKIGLVELSRESTERKQEHQTANPRDLVLVSHFKTECVRAVEKYLHWHYIEHGVRGEWFKFSDEILSGAIKYAEELRDMFADQIASLRDGFMYQSVVSDGRVKPATDEAQRWLREYQVANLISANSYQAYEEFKKAIKEAEERGEDTSDGGTYIDRTRRDLVEEDLMKGDPDLYSKYCFEKITARFTPTKANTAVESDPRVSRAKARSLELVQSIAAMKSGKLDFNSVSQIAFGVDSTGKFFEKAKELSQLHLQAECESAEKIDGICTWKRESGLELDTKRFKKEQDESYERYSIEKTYKVWVPNNKGQAD